ncbi:MAG: hypothetical protein WD054_00560 [Gemmatimonadota bacterium]
MHSGVRYLVLLGALAALAAAAAGWRRGGVDMSKAERGTMAAFVGLVDVQVLIGIALLLNWQFYGQLMGHIMMMVLAAAAAHGGSIMAKRRAPDRSGSGVRVATVVATLVLIVGGILAIQRPIL